MNRRLYFPFVLILASVFSVAVVTSITASIFARFEDKRSTVVSKTPVKIAIPLEIKN